MTSLSKDLNTSSEQKSNISIVCSFAYIENKEDPGTDKIWRALFRCPSEGKERHTLFDSYFNP